MYKRQPILIGGAGEQRTLRIVAQYADYCNVFGDPATVAHKFEVLRRHCETVGRPFEAITLGNNTGLMIARDEGELAAKRERHPGFDGIVGTPQAVVEMCIRDSSPRRWEDGLIQTMEPVAFRFLF